MKKGAINLTIVILVLLAVVGIAAFLLKNQVSNIINPKTETTSSKPPELQALIEPAIKNLPDSDHVTIVSNSDMYVEYLPKDDAYGVTILNPEKEQEVKDAMPKYFEGLGVTDFSTINIAYRVKEQFTAEQTSSPQP